jgi:hypothetical protein
MKKKKIQEALGGSIYPALGGDFSELCAKLNASLSCTPNWHHSSIFRRLDSRRAATLRTRPVIQIL